MREKETIMNNEKLNEDLKEGIIKSFEALEAVRRIVADDMLAKTAKLLGIMIAGEAKERREEGDDLCKEMTKDQEKIDKLTELIKLKEEYIKLFEE
jgi:hypothetical protein